MNDEMVAKRISMHVQERAAACGVHGAHTERGMQFMAGSPIRWAGCSACNVAEREREEDEAKRKVEAQRQARIESKLKAAGIPPALRERSFDDYEVASGEQQSALDAVREFADNFWTRHLPAGAVLVLAGERGTGKGHLAIACAKQVMQRGTAMYLRTADLIRMVRATWRRDSKHSEQEVIDTLCALDLLVIDELGVQRGTDDEQIILFDVIDRRYADLRPTILITNLNGAAFAEVIGPRIMDRLRERAVFVPFNWASYRGRL